MVVRLFATAGAVIPVVAAIAKDGGAAVATSPPDVWHMLGYPFEAGPMIAALCACGAVRFYVVSKDHARHVWRLDLPILALALMFTAAAVIRFRPDPIWALAYGTGLGALGAGIIALAKRYVDGALAKLGLDAAPPEPPAV